MAGTLALMTGYAQAPGECPHRGLMARKIVSNLFFLAGHPQLSDPMRATLGNLRTRWQLTAEGTDTPLTPGSAPTARWHTAHDTLQ